MHNSLYFLTFVIFLLVVPAQAAPGATKIWQVTEGLASPESAYYDAETDAIYVSSLGGDAFTKDGNGYLSKFSRGGKVLAEKWASGLNAPKGIRCHQGLLWVSDLDKVYAFQLSDGKQKHAIEIQGAKFLNDVAIGKDGTVYVSDTVTSRIHRIQNGKAEVFLSEKELTEAPNGLLVVEPYLRVAGWGTGVGADLSSTGPGSLFNINLKTKARTEVLAPLGNLDGLEINGSKAGGFIVSDWVAGIVYLTGKNKKPRAKILEGIHGPADIGLISKEAILLVPEMKVNRLTAYKIVDPGQ